MSKKDRADIEAEERLKYGFGDPKTGEGSRS